MTRFILRRVGLILLTMLLASVLVFAATQLMPGDVAHVVLGQFATPQAVANLREELGLNRPPVVQYLDWLRRFVVGDWGVSIVSGYPVMPLVMARIRNSLMLAVASLCLYVPLGIGLGVIAAVKEDRLFDRAISALSMTFVGLPEFVTGLMMIGLLSIRWKILPATSSIDPNTSFVQAFPYLLMPAVAISLTCLGYIARMTRASTIDVLHSDYVMAANLRGLSRIQVLTKHVLRNSLVPSVTVIAVSIGWLFGGIIVVETVFGYPGLGRLLVYAIQHRDLTLIQGCSMVIVTVFSLANLAADITYAFLNPRIRYSG
jgi:peptide/nickel transport system permease protein